MAKRRKLNGIKKFSIIGVTLIIVQLGYIFIFAEKEKPVSAMEAINKAVKDVPGASESRKQQLKIQLALTDYMAHNPTHKPPVSLEELVPRYFDRVPNDPATGKPFAYKVENDRYFLGEDPNAVAKPGAEAGTTEAQVGALSSDQQQALIASMGDDAEANTWVYDPTGKRDPFRPFDFAPKIDTAGKTELERYDIGQLKVTAILEGFDEPKAIVENSAGRGFTVKKGVKIGPNNGEIIDIKKDRIFILERFVDFTGDTKTKTIELKLRVKDDPQ